jgi:hypothetical protein
LPLEMARVAALVALSMMGCYSTHAPAQALSGRLALDSFPYAVTTLRIEGPAGANRAPVAADGDFRIMLERGGEYRIRFLSASRAGDSALLVFPRWQGMVDPAIVIDRVSAAPFDLGAVRYVGALPAIGLRVPSSDEAVEEDGCDAAPDDGGDGGSSDGGTDDDQLGDVAVPEHSLPRGGACSFTTEEPR